MTDIEEVIRKIKEGLKELEKISEELKSELDSKLEEINKYNIDVDIEELKDFLREPYCILPKKKDEFWVVVPRFVDLEVGWLEHQTPTYNVFSVNKYMQWLTEVPEELKDRIKFEERPQFKVVDGVLVTGKEHQNEAWSRYRDYLSKREGDDRIRIKKGMEFHLIARLIEDGILPFVPTPVSKEDLRPFDKIKLRDYQKEAWDKFVEFGAIGLFYPFGAGKSFFGLYALARVKGKKLVVVPTRTLLEQWQNRIEEYIPEYRDEIELYTYHSYHKIKGKEYSLVIFDEVHHLPANTFIRLSTIKRKYTIGLSGSPFREDGRENYIFALTGFPVGVQWRKFIEKGIVRKPTFTVYVVKNKSKKVEKLKELLTLPLKTVIFCDSIKFGEELSKKLGIPFVHGGTKKDRLGVIEEADFVIVSRVGDEGISLPNIERVIEVDFLYASRMQESQRYGRLMHSKKREPQHIIIMTEEEFEKYEKRLYAITERGFRIQILH